MGRAPCCDKANVKKGPWSPEEDSKLKEYIEKNGTGGNWIALPQKAGLKRCGKSCRLRWLNYLRPNIKHGEFSDEEDRIICSLYANIGSRWSIIAAQLPGRTDNDIKNYWNTKLKKKLMALVPTPPHHHYHQRKSPTLIQSCHDQNPSFPPSSSPHQSYGDLSSSYYASPSSTTISFTGLEPTSNSTNNYPFSFQNQQEASLGDGPINMQYYYMFGSEGSCSTSSDGSCGPAAHISTHGCRDMKQQEMGFHHNYVSNGGLELEFYSNKFMPGYENIMNQYWTAEKPSGYFGQTPLMDYGIEDIKQLISSNSSNNGMFNGVGDENKREEKGMMYYYY